MGLFEKYKGKSISPDIMVSDVEDEIISIVPEFSKIRDSFHLIIDKVDKSDRAVQVTVNSR